jgi:hypothetical protein
LDFPFSLSEASDGQVTAETSPQRDFRIVHFTEEIEKRIKPVDFLWRFADLKKATPARLHWPAARPKPWIVPIPGTKRTAREALRASFLAADVRKS